MTITLAKWMLSDYHQIIETGILNDRRVELLRGEIVEMVLEGEVYADCSHEALENIFWIVERNL